MNPGLRTVLLLVGPLTSCISAAPATWTPPATMQPHLHALDHSGDGTVDATEYESVRWNGPPFATADRNADGALGPDELDWLVATQSATRFDGTGPAPVKPASGMAERRSSSLQHRVESIVWMHSAIVAAGHPGLDSPTLAAVLATRDPQDPVLSTAFDAMASRWPPVPAAP